MRTDYGRMYDVTDTMDDRNKWNQAMTDITKEMESIRGDIVNVI